MAVSTWGSPTNRSAARMSRSHLPPTKPATPPTAPMATSITTAPIATASEDPRAVDHAGEVVAALHVGAEPVLGRRRKPVLETPVAFADRAGVRVSGRR